MRRQNRPKLRGWTEAQDDELRELWPRATQEQIAAMLGRGQQTISERGRALGLPARGHGRPRGWTVSQTRPAPKPIVFVSPAMRRLAEFDPIVRRSLEAYA